MGMYGPAKGAGTVAKFGYSSVFQTTVTRLSSTRWGSSFARKLNFVKSIHANSPEEVAHGIHCQ